MTNYVIGTKEYKPRAMHNKRVWDLVTAHLAKNKSISQAQLHKLLKLTPAAVAKLAAEKDDSGKAIWREAKRNTETKKYSSVSGYRDDGHTDMIGYMVRKQYLKVAA